MLHPVGSHTSAVYWRRRLLLFGSLVLVVVLIVLTLRAVLGGGDGSDPAGAQTPSTLTSQSHAGSTSASSSHTRRSDSGSRGSAARHTASTTASSSAPGRPVTCSAKQLEIAAKVGKHSYSVGDKPVLMLQVTNAGPGPCVQDLADRQVVLEVYNGASRVWGSHDCKIEPGEQDRTLTAEQPVRVSIVWSGLSSRPQCAGTRQRVGAGTYTLYATLSGHRGKAAQFSIS